MSTEVLCPHFPSASQLLILILVQPFNMATQQPGQGKQQPGGKTGQGSLKSDLFLNIPYRAPTSIFRVQWLGVLVPVKLVYPTSVQIKSKLALKTSLGAVKWKWFLCRWSPVLAIKSTVATIPFQTLYLTNKSGSFIILGVKSWCIHPVFST